MPVAPDVQSLTTAAEQSASGGDFASAAHYLKLAADLQEAGAGSMPSELANTLNNLGVVYERLDRPDDAERCYRRSYAVARAVLPPDHPSVVLSEKNLRDFCEGRGISFEQVPDAGLKPLPTTEVDAGLKPRPTTDRAEDRPRSMLVLGAIAAMALVVLAFMAVRSIGRNDPPSTPAPASPVATPSVPSPAAPEPEPRTPAPEPAPVSAAPAPVRPEPPPVARAAVVPTVVSASVCGSLRTSGEWQCGPLTGGPGTFFFVTRLAAPAATTVEHRWYRDGRLHQSVTLRVSANPQHGYRTYSRVTIGAERAGEWRTELRSSAGTVLHEERFTVVP